MSVMCFSIDRKIQSAHSVEFERKFLSEQQFESFWHHGIVYNAPLIPFAMSPLTTPKTPLNSWGIQRSSAYFSHINDQSIVTFVSVKSDHPSPLRRKRSSESSYKLLLRNPKNSAQPIGRLTDNDFAPFASYNIYFFFYYGNCGIITIKE